MKKIRLFLMLSVLSVVYLASAQENPTWKTAQMSTWKVQYMANEETRTIDSVGVDNLYKDYYYYDKAGNLITKLTYSVSSNTLRDKIVYTYNSQNKVLSETRSMYDFYQIIYEYDASGVIVQKTTKTNTKYNTLIETCEFSYDEGGRLIKETYKNSNGKDFKKYQYTYDKNGVLEKRDNYSDPNNEGNIVLAETTTYVFDEDGRELKNSTVKYINTTSEPDIIEVDRKCYEYDEQGRLKVDSLYHQHLMASALVPSLKHIYIYDNNGALVKVLEYGGDSDQTDLDKPGNFPMLLQYYDYTPQIYSEKYATSNLSVSAGDDPRVVKITFDAPAVTEGLDGYKVMIDGVISEEVYTGTEITLKKQKKGEHIYYIFSVYNGELANASDPITFNVELICPPVTNVEVTAYEYSSWQWNLTLRWDAPVRSNLTLLNYRCQTGTKTSTSLFNTANISTYSTGKITIKVYAVYEEGESEPCTIEFTLPADVNDKKIVHWHNSGYTKRNANNEVLETSSSYYKDNSGNEQLVAEVQYDGQGKPIKKIETSSNSTMKTETQYVWSVATWEWTRDTQITFESNFYGQLMSKKTKVIGENGRLTDKALEKYTYAKESMQETLPIQTDCWLMADDTTLVTVKKHSYEGGVRTDIIYKPDSITITGKEEYYYVDAAKVDSMKVYTYDGVNYTPISRTVITYLTETKLVATETTDKYVGGKWIKDIEKVYNASSVYQPAHAVLDFTATEGDNFVQLSWKAPADSVGLTGYKVYANDVLVQKALITAADTAFKVKGLPTGRYTMSILAVYNTDQEANYVTASGIVSHTEMTELFGDLKEMLSAGVSSKEYSYEVTGEVLVTGALELQSYGENYFIEDAMGAVNVILQTDDVVPAFEFKVGDKIKGLKGLLKEENGSHYFIYESAELVSKDNSVNPTVIILKEFVENPANIEAKYVKFENVTFSDEVDPGNKLLPSVCHMIQDGVTATLTLGKEQIEKPEAANVSGFVMKADDGWTVMLNGKESFECMTGISMLEFAEIYYADGEVAAEGASSIEIFDITGCQVSYSENGHVAVNEVTSGIVIAKVTYMDGNIKIVKFAVK